MSAGFAGDQLSGPSRIFTGIVYEIYPTRGEIDIKVSYPDNRFYEKVPYSSAFKDKGLAGFDFVPTRGCTVLLLENSSEDAQGLLASPIVVGFMAPPGKSIDARVKLLPSDVQVSGKYGNNLLLRSNGDAYLVGDSRNLIAFITTEELTKLRTSNYEHEHAGGRVRWMVDGNAQGGAVAYMHGIKRYGSDDSPYLSISAGTDAAGGLEIRMASESGELKNVANPIFVNDVPLGCAFKVSVDMTGNVDISATGKVSVESLGAMSIASKAAINMEAPQITFTSVLGGISFTSGPGEPTRIVIPEGLEIVTPRLKIIQGTTSLVSSSEEEGHSKKVVTEDLLDWVLHHRHLNFVVPTGAFSGTSAGLTTRPLNAAGVLVGDQVYSSILSTFGVDLASGLSQVAQINSIIANEAQEYSANKESALTKETKVR